MKVDIKLIGYERKEEDDHDIFTFYDNNDVSEIVVKLWDDGNITVECETYFESIVKAVEIVKAGVFKGIKDWRDEQ